MQGSPVVRGASLASVLGLLCLFGFTGIYLAHLPPVLGIKDEVGFVNQALVWRFPELRRQLDARPVEDFIEVGGRMVSWRNPGRSLSLLPFTALGRPEVYALTGLVFHLGTTLLAARLLSRHGRSPLWAILVLFHPTLALYSRTAMADGPAATFVLLAVLLLERPRGGPFWAGLSLGAAAVFRYHAGILVPALAVHLAVASRGRARWRRAGSCLLGGGLVGLALVAYNWTTYGRPFGFTGQGAWSPAFVVSNARAYGLALALFWPLMLVAPLVHRRPARGAVWTLSLTLLVTMLLYSWHDEGAGTLETSVLGLRLLQPVLPLWIVAYAEALGERLGGGSGRIRSAAVSRLVCPLAAAGLLVAQAALFRQHQRHLRALHQTREEIAATIPEGSLVVANATVRKLFAPLDAGLPVYRWLPYDQEGKVVDWEAALAAEEGPWYLAIRPKRPGYEFPEVLREYEETYRARRLPTRAPALLLYRVDP